MTSSKTATDISQNQAVQEQYVTYPYPMRSPKDEAHRLITGSPSFLPEITHYLFQGISPFHTKRERPLRILVAGGGTGDATVMLAQTLASVCGPMAHIWHVDLSLESLNIVKDRLAQRQLTNVTFHHGPLETLSQYPDFQSPFDYIDCCGVLHHLQDPLTGLRCLTQILHPHGGMGLMVYAPYGRTGVYEMQQMMHHLMPDHSAPTERLKVGKTLLNALPQTNWLTRNPFVTDHQQGGDAGIYDLLLHSRDRAYTVAELTDLTTQAHLKITGWIEPCRYLPDTYLRPSSLLNQIQALPQIQQAAFCELLAGNMKKHIIYVTHANSKNLSSSCAFEVDRDICDNSKIILHKYSGSDLAKTARKQKAITARLDGTPLSYPLSGLALSILAQIPLCDPTAPSCAHIPDMHHLFQIVSQQNPDLQFQNFETAFKQLTHSLISINLGSLHNAYQS